MCVCLILFITCPFSSRHKYVCVLTSFRKITFYMYRSSNRGVTCIETENCLFIFEVIFPNRMYPLGIFIFLKQQRRPWRRTRTQKYLFNLWLLRHSPPPHSYGISQRSRKNTAVNNFAVLKTFISHRQFEIFCKNTWSEQRGMLIIFIYFNRVLYIVLTIYYRRFFQMLL